MTVDTAGAYRLKTGEAEARARWDAYWAGEALDRPLLTVTARNPAWTPPPPRPPRDPRENDVDPAHYERMVDDIDSRIWLADAMPGVVCGFGANIALLPHLVGADYTYESGSAWVHTLEGVYERELRFDPAHPTVRALEEGLRRAAARLDGRGYLQPPPLGVDPLTTLSLLRGQEALCLDLLERPELVERWLDGFSRLFRTAADHFDRFVDRLGYAGRSSWLHCWAPGTLEAVQCDAAVLLSRPMFRRFVLPDLERQCAGFQYSLYHLDGTCQMRFLDDLRGVPGLRGIQWNPEPPANDIADPRWIAALREIRARGFLLQFNHWESRTVEQVEAVVRALGPSGLAFALPTFATVAEAEAAIERIARACR